jgi:hypothetical protein
MSRPTFLGGGGGRATVDTISMPLGLAFGFAMVGVSFEDWLPHKNYSHAGNLRVLCQLRYFVLLYSLAVWRIVPNFRWALSDQKGMSYLA